MAENYIHGLGQPFSEPDNTSAYPAILGRLPEGARFTPRVPVGFGKKQPTFKRGVYEWLLRNAPVEKIRDEVTVPLMNEIEKGAKENRDSANAFMYRATNPSERLIEESLTNHLRKFGK